MAQRFLKQAQQSLIKSVHAVLIKPGRHPQFFYGFKLVGKRYEPVFTFDAQLALKFDPLDTARIDRHVKCLRDAHGHVVERSTHREVQMKRRTAAGFSLIELLIVLAVMLVLFSMAATNAVQIMHGYHVSQARTQVTRVRDLTIQLALCQASATPPTACQSLPAMLPATGQLTTQEYTFNYSGPGSTWSYTATPLVYGMMSLYADQTGVMRCSMNPTSPAGPASPACQ